jgi:hypothetical protein
VAYLLKARIVKPAETAIAREWLCKQQPLLGSDLIAITNATLEYLWEVVFSMQSMLIAA